MFFWSFFSSSLILWVMYSDVMFEYVWSIWPCNLTGDAGCPYGCFMWSWFSDLLRQLKSFQGWKPKMDQNQIHQPTKSHEFRQWQAHFDAFFSSYSVVYNHLGYMSIRRNTSRSMALGGSARHVLCESIKSTICGIYWLELVWLDRTWSTRNLNLYGIDKNLSINPSGWLRKGYRPDGT